MSKYQKMSLEKLEYSLPIRIQCREKKEMPCPDCKRDINIAVNYVQHLWRSDSYGINNRKTRAYEISFRNEDYSGKVLFRTNRYHSLREALVEAHEKLDEMGVEK